MNAGMNVHEAIEANAHNQTALWNLPATGWVNPPRLRGTSDIIWSCLVTLTACLYTGLHLNIPPNSTSLGQFWYRLKYVPLAWLAPDFFLIRAVREYLDAFFLMSALNKRPKVASLVRLSCRGETFGALTALSARDSREIATPYRRFGPR